MAANVAATRSASSCFIVIPFSGWEKKKDRLYAQSAPFNARARARLTRASGESPSGTETIGNQPYSGAPGGYNRPLFAPHSVLSLQLQATAHDPRFAQDRPGRAE